MSERVEPSSRATGVSGTPRPAHEQPTVAHRVGALDGLRGLVILTVVLNHAIGKLWPRGPMYDLPVFAGLLTGGAVTVFFVVGAFIVTHNLEREMTQDRMDPLRFYLRRLIRLGVQLVPLCVVLVVLHFVDDREPSTSENITQNVAHLLTYTFNLWGAEDLLGVRPEVGHLWYLSVQQQAYLVLPLVLLLFLRWRRSLAVGLVVAALLCFWWRLEVLERDGWILASTLTSTRVDAVVWGVVAAIALPWVTRVRAWPLILIVSCGTLLALKLVLPELGAFSFLGVWSVAFMLAAGVVVVAIWSMETSTRLTRFLGHAVLRRLGKSSLSIYVWHLPVFVVLARHTPEWSWPLRSIVGLAILAAVVLLLELFVEEPTRRYLATSRTLRLARVS